GWLVVAVGRHRWTHATFGRHLHRLAIAQHVNAQLLTRLGASHLVRGAAAVAGGLAINAANKLARWHAGAWRRAPAIRAGARRARPALQAKGVGQLRRQRLDFDAQPATDDLAVFDNGLHHLQRKLDRDGEANALGPTGFGKNRGVDANQIAVRVD